MNIEGRPETMRRQAILGFLLIYATTSLSYVVDGDFDPTDSGLGVFNSSQPQRMWDPEKGSVVGDGLGPLTANNASVTHEIIQMGSTAFLKCQVRNMADKQVSWIRRRDYHILTSGIFTYSTDARFSVVRAEDSEDWALQIRFVQTRDQGLYECQVSTKNGKYGYLVNLTVVAPQAEIQGATELHIEPGSTIELVCIIHNTLNPPNFIFWYHDQVMINYDYSRGGITVKTHPIPTPTSKLTITHARFSDSGNYTCAPSSALVHSVNVYVTNEMLDDKTAAIQRYGSGADRPTNNHFMAGLIILLFTIPTVLGLCHIHYNST